MKKKSILLFATALLMTVSSCQKQVHHDGRTPLVEIGGEYLYLDEMQKVIPQNLRSEDSVQWVEDFIRNWVEEELLYQKAEHNVRSNDHIEQMVRDYRKALIMQDYQQQLIAEKLGKEITETEMRNFYQSHQDLFVLKEPAIMGLFIKVPKSANELNELKKWYQHNDDASLKKIEKYCFKNAVIYEYFYDHWVPLSDLDGKMKMNLNDLEHNLEEHKNFEMEDEEFCYLLHVEAFVLKGKLKPFDMAKGEIVDLLTNYRQVDFIQQVKKDLYDQSDEMGRVKRYYKEENE